MTKLSLSSRVLVGLLAGIAVLGTLPSAEAAEPPAAATAKPAPKPDKKTSDAARKAFGDGQKAYTAGDYAAAQASFTKANELIASPQASYWIAKSLDSQNKTEEAIQAYEALLADPNADKVGEDKVADARSRLESLKATLVGEITLEANPMLATIAVDGVAQPGEVPMTLKLTPGRHRITVSAPGYVAQDLDIEVKAGERTQQSVTLVREEPPAAAPVALPPEPAPPPPPPKPVEGRSMVPAYVTLGIAGVGAVVGTIFGISALNAKSDFNKNPSTELADDAERDALISDMAFGVAITLGVTGVVLLTSDEEPPPAANASRFRSARLKLTPYAGKKSGGASAQLSF